MYDQFHTWALWGAYVKSGYDSFILREIVFMLRKIEQVNKDDWNLFNTNQPDHITRDFWIWCAAMTCLAWRWGIVVQSYGVKLTSCNFGPLLTQGDLESCSSQFRFGVERLNTTENGNFSYEIRTFWHEKNVLPEFKVFFNSFAEWIFSFDWF